MIARFVAPLAFAISLSFLSPLAHSIRAQTSAATTATTIHVGILREDAALVPIALFNGRKWTTPWPHEFEADEDSRTWKSPPPLRSVPRAWWGGTGPQLQWELLNANDARRPVRVRNTVRFVNHCTAGVALKTDYTTRVKIEPDSYPLPYAGIVSTAPGALQLVRAHKRGTETFTRVARELPALFRRYGQRAWTDIEPAHRPNFSGRLPAPHLWVVFSGELPDGRHLIHFSANGETLATVSGQQRERLTQLTGWLVEAQGSSTLTVLAVQATATDPDGKSGGGTFNPLASLTISGRTYWIGGADGYEWEGYVIVDVTGTNPREVVSVEAGGC